MGAGAQIYSRATTHSGLSALIGTRCYPGRLPSSPTLPAITYRRVALSTDEHVDHDGPPGREVAQFQLDCYDDTPDGAAALADQVVAAFHCWDNGTEVGWCMVKNRLEGFETAINREREIVTMRMEHKRD